LPIKTIAAAMAAASRTNGTARTSSVMNALI
jgi:hypothetical protein